MSTITRTLSNLRKIGFKQYVIQMMTLFDGPPTTSDTKYGQLIGTDKFGNKYYENNEELPLRTRWVDYKKHDYDAGHIEPGWHAWISYAVDQPPTQDALLQTKVRKWERPESIINLTATPGAYKPYNTTVPKLSAWQPKVADRR
ncbi:NADH dehydrogenase [ubiquinone] 1 alpha subcomplex subunit N7BM [Ceratocystis fimbriata CBS 114723]|uniref:NADH dehydrogenase [ubiquinone] 1 alpha subcomplex subunit n=1 Tax=Ceratocystis fimbriata CBS 114723 TaxID=1035309 RepID=A0A2C5X2U5_9PEZI|nr:NADH dehydrogenase [ubiquinone] 1 alpha subcomplex subunit N7BM [Ceratocystis fimbriata CBS 114723]